MYREKLPEGQGAYLRYSWWPRKEADNDGCHIRFDFRPKFVENLLRWCSADTDVWWDISLRVRRRYPGCNNCPRHRKCVQSKLSMIMRRVSICMENHGLDLAMEETELLGPVSPTLIKSLIIDYLYLTNVLRSTILLIMIK